MSDESGININLQNGTEYTAIIYLWSIGNILDEVLQEWWNSVVWIIAQLRTVTSSNYHDGLVPR